MKSIRNNRWVGVSLWIILVFFLAFLFLHVFSFTRPAQKLLMHRVQNAVSRTDGLLHETLDQILSSLPDDDFDASVFYPSLSGSKNVSVLLFQHDSLVFWNSNVIEPKLIRRRVPLDCDSLIHFPCGDYLFLASSHSDYSVYLFSLLNSTYPFENEFFVNKFLPFPVKKTLVFSSVPHADAFPVYSSHGDLVAYCLSEKNTSFGFSNASLPVVCFMVILLCVYLLVFRNIRLSNPLPSSPSSWLLSLPLVGILFLFVAVVLGFRYLFGYGFSKGSFIPLGMSVDWSMLWYFLAFLILLTFLLIIKAGFILLIIIKKSIATAYPA